MLRRASEMARFDLMSTFAGSTTDAATALQRGSALTVAAGRRSDVVSVSMESPYPDEARRIVDAILAAYLEERVTLRTAVARDVGSLIEKERAELDRRHAACQEQLAQAARESGVASLADPTNNTAIRRSSAIAEAVTSAELRQSALLGQRQATAALLDSPARRSDYVQSLQSRGRDSGDATYADLRQQLLTLETNLTVMTSSLGDKHPRVAAARSAAEALRQRLADYELTLTRSNVEALTTESDSTRTTLEDLVALEHRQRSIAQDVGAAAARYRAFSVELDRIERQAEQLEQRATANRIDNVVASSLDARVLEPAQVSAGPVLPRKGMTLGVALIAGLTAGAALALCREATDTRLRSADAIAPLYDTRVLARVPRITSNDSPLARAMIVRLHSRGPAAEAYRTLRIMLSHGRTKSAKTILVASPASGDGKSTTASNLAIAFAEAGERTLLIDADLRGPVQHLVFELDPSVGLSRVLSGDMRVGAALQPSGIERLDVLAGGPLPACPSDLLGSQRLIDLLTLLADAYDRIVIDSPPLAQAPDAAVLAAAADATVLVVRINSSSLRLADQAVAMLRNVNAHLAGAVANDVAASSAGHYLDGSWRYSAYARRFAIEPGPAAALAELSGPLEAMPDRFESVTSDRPSSVELPVRSA